MSTTERPPPTAHDWPLVQAARLVVEKQHCTRRTTSRELRLGWAVTGRILDELQRLDVVGPDQGDEPGTRKVLAKPGELDDVLEHLRANAIHLTGGESDEKDTHNQLVADTEAFDEHRGGDKVLRGRLGVAEVHADEPGAELVVRDEGEVAEVVDAELVPQPEPEPVTLIGTIVQEGPGAALEMLRDDPRVRTAGKVVGPPVGVVVTVLKGWESWVRRAGAAATHGSYRDAIRAAEAAGDREGQAAWAAALEKAKTDRAKRVKEWVDLLPKIAALAVGVAAGLVALLVVLGFVVQLTPDGEVCDADGVCVRDGMNLWDWWGGIWGWALWAGAAALWVLWVAKWAALPLLVLGGWREGQRVAVLPGWLQVNLAADEPENVIVTPGGIAAALEHLNIPALKKAFKDGWQVEFHTPPVRVNNRGYHSVFSLPMGVTPGMLADQRDVFARNLFRGALDVWPTDAERAGFVDLWVSDAGSTEKPAPEYPLLHEGAADVFAGIPLGVSQRGEVIAPPLVQANLVFGGMMGQGKSNAGRVVMAGAALDPLPELRVYVFAGNGDYDAYEPRLAVYERGTGDDVVIAAVHGLRELYEEVGRRENRLSDLGAKKVTRTLATQHLDLRPIVAMFSECHELFSHPEYGKEAADLAVQILRRARKTGIILGFDTQSSRADAIPPKIVELVKLNACFAVKTWRSNDGFLGDGSFQAGIRATELRPGKDVGTSILTGATAERFELLKWFFIEVDDDRGFDAAADIIARAMNGVHPAVPVGGSRARAELEAERDLLEDLAAVLGHEPLPIADVPPLLRAHAPRWAPYQKLTGKALKDKLGRVHGIKVPSTGNRWPLDPAAVREALVLRAAVDLDEE